MRRRPSRACPALARLALCSALAFGAPALRAETLADLKRQVEDASRRVQNWITLASRDPREDVVDAYAKQSEDDFKKPAKQRVTAARLVEIMAGLDASDKVERAHDGLRLRAATVLAKATTLSPDPDLSLQKRGSRTPRRDFAMKNLVDLLDDDKKADRLARGSANDILKAWFGSELDAGQRAAVDVYNADNEKSWKATRRAWVDAIGRG